MSNALYRRILQLIGRGRVTSVSDAGPVQTMQAKFLNAEIHDNLARLAEFGFTSNPPDGSDIVVGFFGGDRTNGAVIATGHQPSRPTGLLAGESMLYSQDGKHIYMTSSGGIVVEAKNQMVTINDASTVVVNAGTTITLNAPTSILANTPLLKVSGDIIDNSGTNPHTMAQMRSIYNGHTHSVNGIQAGSSNINSSAPAQTE